MIRGAAVSRPTVKWPPSRVKAEYNRDIVKGIYPHLAPADVRRAWLCRRLEYLWGIKKPKTADYVAVRIAQRRIALIEATRAQTATNAA